MARKITTEAVNAFYNREERKISNTQIVNKLGNTYMYLHNNLIAILDNQGRLKITNAGWFSDTTKERLNGLNGVSITQQRGTWYLNGNEWNGNLIEIG